MFCKECGCEIPADSKFCFHCGKRQGFADPQPTVVPPQPDEQAVESVQSYAMPMNWYNFLIYFHMFFGALGGAINGVLYLFGQINGELREASIWMVFWDSVYGIALLGLAALSVYTRSRLAGYYEDGPSWLQDWYLFSMIATVVYSVAYLMISSGFLPDGEFKTMYVTVMMVAMAVAIVVNLLIRYANRVYFRKRKEMFNR